jgi:hypothetical protein
MGGAPAPSAYVCIISPKSRANYELCRKLGLWGFTKQAQSFGNAVRAGDFLWFYVGAKGFLSLARAQAAAERFPEGEMSPWKDGREYALRLPMRYCQELWNGHDQAAT